VIKIKKIITLIIISFFFITGIDASIKDSLFATVGNKAITRSDIINEIKIILILNNQSFSDDNAAQLEAAAINVSIKRAIKKIEIEKYELSYSRSDLEKELDQLAKNVNMDLDTLKSTFVANNIEFSNLTDQVRVELLWNSLIFKLYKNRLLINPNEIEEQLKLVQENKEIEEYLISEMIIQPVEAGQIDNEIQKIKNQIDAEGFAQVARRLSIAETAIKGGDLGWINENVITEKFRKQIMKTPINNISDPIILPQGVLIFHVRDKRKMKAFSTLEELKDQLVNAEKTKLLRMHSLSHYENLRRSITINYFE
tara:strand:+ start:953 stop:1888 length:936 start_codon:yes stop_codon:yes gene_type:complete